MRVLTSNLRFFPSKKSMGNGIPLLYRRKSRSEKESQCRKRVEMLVAKHRTVLAENDRRELRDMEGATPAMILRIKNKMSARLSRLRRQELERELAKAVVQQTIELKKLRKEINDLLRPKAGIDLL